MYKIFILERYDEIKPLWTPYMVKDENGRFIEYFAEENSELSNTLIKLLDTVPKKDIKLYKDVSYIIDAIISDDF